uniref:H(+)-transporting two-sector ATPase n=1 Tax=Cunninghamia lanceolata TaxID=28977 RepID=A0A8F4RHK8_CUNLA|nr:ATP synthase subunit 8 [Cunninghamia lanceolata]BDG69831.1 ATPase subunit 8 [Cunninghamia lanceolata var. konishii]
MMPQLDQFTYFAQFFRCCLIFFAYHLPLCNDGVPRLSRIPKPRNRLVPHQRRGDNIQSPFIYLGPNSLEDISVRIFTTGTSYMDSSLFEVSRWCDADLLGRKKKTSLSRFGEISGSRGIDGNILYLIPKSSYGTTPNPLPGRRTPWREGIELIHVSHSQVNLMRGLLIHLPS